MVARFDARFNPAPGIDVQRPLFLPVFQPGGGVLPMDAERFRAFGVEACICNAFFLYKNREVRARFEAGLTLSAHLGFDGMLVTDSGAFQGFSRPLYLDNRTIVRFQQAIGAHVVSPLDLVTPPGDSRREAERKHRTTLKRVEEALGVVDRAVLAGVQQGGRFLDLRRESVRALVHMGCRYIAVGSLVPFFNTSHDLTFVGDVIRDARAVVPPAVPIHVYGAGDPVELPFYMAFGADVFDSSSYAHFALKGRYMTPYGAHAAGELPWTGDCPCAACATHGEAVFAAPERLAAHNLHAVLDTIRRARRRLAEGTLLDALDEIAAIHAERFPASRLPASWMHHRDRVRADG